MRGAALGFGGLLTVACLYANPEFGARGEATSSAASGGTAATDGGTTGEVGGTTGAAATTDAGGGTGSVATGEWSTSAPVMTGTSGGLPDLGGAQYPHYPSSSCRALQEYLTSINAEPAVSGYYNLEIGGVAVDVYCDMALEGGGWTLVGRSAGVDQLTSFGWRSARGAVDDDAQAYSLDLTAHPLEFSAIVLGDYTAGKAWGGNAYQFDVEPGYVEDNADKSVLMGYPKVLSGGCMPWATWMFQRGGYTASDQAFFFRDLEPMDTAYFGLLANGFYLHTYDNCGMTGDLNHKQGMLMVR